MSLDTRGNNILSLLIIRSPWSHIDHVIVNWLSLLKYNEKYGKKWNVVENVKIHGWAYEGAVLASLQMDHQGRQLEPVFASAHSFPYSIQHLCSVLLSQLTCTKDFIFLSITYVNHLNDCQVWFVGHVFLLLFSRVFNALFINFENHGNKNSQSFQGRSHMGR